MIIHARQALRLKPLQRVVVMCSSAEGWHRIASELQVHLGRARFLGPLQDTYVCTDFAALEEHLGEEPSYLDDVTLCRACQAMKMCRFYDRATEKAAEQQLLLTGEWNGDGLWSWSAPQPVVDAAGVLDPAKSEALMKKLAVGRAGQGKERIGLQEAILSIMEEEQQNLRSFLTGTRKRVQKKVQQNAGAVAANVAGQIFDDLADKGAQRLWEALRQQTSGRWRPSEERSPSDADQQVSAAERMLGLSWPYSSEELEKAFRQAAMRSHPDRGGSTEAMTALNQSRTLLKQRRFTGQ